MSNSDRVAKERYVRFVCMWPDGNTRLIVLPTRARITEVLEDFAQRHPTVLSDHKVEAVVVIEGFTSAQLYRASTFRWLCGAGPDPTGKDSNWMGGAADWNVVGCKPEYGVGECAAKEDE